MSTGQHDGMAVQFEYSEYDDELYGGDGGYDDDDLDGGENDDGDHHLHDDRYAANDAAFEDGGESEGDADVAAAAAAEARALERAKQRQDAKPLSPRGAHVNHALVIADKPTQAVVVNVDMHGLPLPLQQSSSFASSPSAVVTALAAAAAKQATPTSSTTMNEAQQESRDTQGDKDTARAENDARAKTTAEKKRAQPKPRTLTLGPYPSPSKQAQEAASQPPKTATPTSTKTHTKVARSAKRSLSSPSSSKPRDGPATSKGDRKLGAKSSDGAPACAGVPTGPVVWSGSKPPRHRTPGARDEASRRLFITESTAQRQPPNDSASISPRDPTSTEPYMSRTLPSIASKSTTPDMNTRAGLQASSSALVVSDGRGAMTPPALSRTQTAQLAPRALTPAVLGGVGKTAVAPRSSTSLGERRKQAKIVVRRECFTPGLAPRSEPSLFTRAREAEEEDEGYGDGGDDRGDDLAYLNSGMSKDVLSAVRSAVAAAGGEKKKSADPKTSGKKSNSGTAETPTKKRRSTTSAGTGDDTGLPLLDSPVPGTTLHPESRTGGGGNLDEELDWGSGNNNPTGGGGSRQQQASQEEREKQTRVTSAKAQQKTVLQDVLLRHGHSGTGNRATELTMFDLGPSDRAAQLGVPSLEKWPLRATSTKAPDALAQIDHRIATAKSQKEQFDQEQVRAARRLHPSTVSPAVSPRGSREPLHTPRRRAEIPPCYTSAGNSDVRSKGDPSSSSEPLVPVRNPVDKVIRQLEGARAPKRDASGGTLISAGGFAGGETSSASRLVPGFLDGISEWMRSELQTVPVSEGNEGVLRVCRLAFDQVIEQFTTYQPILGAIRGAYERRLDELEGEAETHLAIAEELQKERERFFASEAGAAIRINEANKRAEKMFNDMKDAEAQLVLTEDKVKDKQLQLQMERDTARLEAVQERAVRRDMEDNLKTYQRLYGEMKEKWSLAKDEVIEYRRSVESQLMSLTREREALLADKELTARRTQSEKLDLQVMIDQLATHSLTPEKMAEFNAQRESTKQSIANLQSKIEWLERELETKSEHEPRVNWDELDAEFGAWRSEGLTSHEVANRVVRRLNRLQRKYDTAATVASRVQPLTELFGGADLCAAALDFADNDVASRRWAGPNAGAPTFISTNQGAHNAANAEQLFAQNGGYSAHSLMLRRAVLISLGYDIQDPRFSSLTSMISIGKELFSKSYLKAASGALLELEAGAGRRASPQRSSTHAGAVSASAIGNANGGDGPRRSTAAARQSSTAAAPTSAVMPSSRQGAERGRQGTSPLRTTTAGGGGAVRAFNQSVDVDDESGALAKAGLIKKETPNERERRLTLEKEQHRVEALLKEERDFVTKLHEPVQEDLTEGTHPYVPPHWRSRVSAQFVPPSTKDHFTVRSMMACALVTMAAARIPSIHLALEAIWKKSFLPQFAQPLQFGIFGRCLVRRLHQTFAADPFLGDFCVSLLDGSRPAAAHAHQLLLQLRFAVRTFTDVERAITGATQAVAGVGTAAGPAHPGPFGQPPVVPAGLAALNIGTHVTSMTNINAGGANGAAGVGSGGGFTPQLSLAAATAAAAFSGGSGATATNASHALGSGNALSAMAHSPLAASVGASVASEGRSSVAESRPKLTGFLPKAIFLDAMASAFPLKPGYDIVALKHALYVQHSGCAPFVAELQKAAALGHNTPSTNAGPKKKTPGQRGAGAGNRGAGGRGGTTGVSSGPPQGSGGAMIGQAAKLWHQVAHVNYGNPFHLFGSIAEGHMSPLLEALVCEQYPRDVLTAEAHIFSMLVNSSEEYYGRSFVTASKMKKSVADFITTPGIAAKLILRVEPNPVAPAIAMGVEDEGFMRPMHLKGRLSSVQSLASSVGKGGARRPSTTPSGFSETMETVDSDDESKQNSQQVTARGGGDGKASPGTDTKGKEKDGDKKDKKKHDPRGRPPPGPKPVRRPGDKRTGGGGPNKEETTAQPQEELSPHEEALRALRAAELQQQRAVAAAVEASAPKVALLIASALQVPDSLGLFGRPPFGEDAEGPSGASPAESPTKASQHDTKSAAEDPATRSLKDGKDGAGSVVGDSKTSPDVGGQKARQSVNSASDVEQTQTSQRGAQPSNKPRSASQQQSSGGLISSPTGDGIVPPALSAFSVMHGASVLSVASNDSGDGGRGGGGGGGGGASARRSLRLPYTVDGAWSDHFLPDVPPRGSAGFEDSIVHIRTDDLPSALWSDTPLKTHLCQSFRPETAPLGIDKKGNIVGMHKGTERDISQPSRPTSPLASPFRSPTSFSSLRHSANPTVAALSMSMSQRSPTQGGAAGTNAGTQRGSESRQGQGQSQSQVGQGSAPTSPVQAIPMGDLMVQSPQDAGLASPDAKSGAGGAAPNGGSSHSLMRSGSGHSGAGAASEKSPPRAEMVGTLPPPKAAPPRAILEPLCGVVDALDAIRSLLPLSSPLLVRLAVGSYNVPVPAVFGPCGEEYTKGVGLAHGLMYDAPGTWSRHADPALSQNQSK